MGFKEMILTSIQVHGSSMHPHEGPVQVSKTSETTRFSLPPARKNTGAPMSNFPGGNALLEASMSDFPGGNVLLEASMSNFLSGNVLSGAPMNVQKFWPFLKKSETCIGDKNHVRKELR